MLKRLWDTIIDKSFKLVVSRMTKKDQQSWSFKLMSNLPQITFVL